MIVLARTNETEMIDEAHRRFQSVSFEVCDPRELAGFPNGVMDLVWFSYNGIDSIGHSDRLRALGEIYRVLAPGGAFCLLVAQSQRSDQRALESLYGYRNRNAHPLKYPDRFFQAPDRGICAGLLRLPAQSAA
jgi:ubiquinone/menaquinone biosynthesis C-methylase UbiE